MRPLPKTCEHFADAPNTLEVAVIYQLSNDRETALESEEILRVDHLAQTNTNPFSPTPMSLRLRGGIVNDIQREAITDITKLLLGNVTQRLTEMEEDIKNLNIIPSNQTTLARRNCVLSLKFRPARNTLILNCTMAASTINVQNAQDVKQ
jgi:hypothetical protein